MQTDELPKYRTFHSCSVGYEQKHKHSNNFTKFELTVLIISGFVYQNRNVVVHRYATMYP